MGFVLVDVVSLACIVVRVYLVEVDTVVVGGATVVVGALVTIPSVVFGLTGLPLIVGVSFVVVNVV